MQAPTQTKIDVKNKNNYQMKYFRLQKGKINFHFLNIDNIGKCQYIACFKSNHEIVEKKEIKQKIFEKY